MITWPQIRAVLANGGRMVGAAGQPVGGILEVVVGSRTGQPTWVSIRCSLCGKADVVVPLARARLLDGSVQVPYAATDVCAAPRVDGSTGWLERWQEVELRRYYAVLDARAPAWPEELPGQDTPATPVLAPAWPAMAAMPATATNGHRRAAGAAPGPGRMNAELDLLPVIPGVEVRGGDDSTTAYPSTTSGPWPPVSTSSSEPPWWRRRQWRWPSVQGSVRAMRLELRPLLDLTGLPDDDLEDLVLAAGEAAANAVEHARLPSLPFFDVLTEVAEGRARIVIQDHGRWRTPTAGSSQGRGLKMMGALAEATLTVEAEGTTVILCNRSGSSL